MRKKLFILSMICVVVIGITSLVFCLSHILEKKESKNKKNEIVDKTFSTRFIKESHKNIDDVNYMISPYSVELALSMLKDGATGKTFDEIESAVPKRNIKYLGINNKLNIANAVFVNNLYKDYVSGEYLNNIKNNYNADLIYDDFITPNAINDWVDRKTYGMIKDLVSDVDPSSVLSLVNAVAMEEKWLDSFECDNTFKKEFTSLNNEKYDVSMMSETFNSNVSYYKDENADIVIIPYKKYDVEGNEVNDSGEQLEFIGILPKNIDKYINSINIDAIRKIENEKEEASSELLIHVELPKYISSYDFKDFKKTLNNMGIKRVFNDSESELKKVVNTDKNAYVGDAIHKTYISVDESGTKAAAVTHFNTQTSSAVPEKKDRVDIIFDKPFIYMIKDVNSDEILFFGVMSKPNDYVEPIC